MDPLVSVVIPVWNRAERLTEAVESVLVQVDLVASVGIEVILVDDGSNDGSAEVADQLAATHLAVTAVHRTNGGPAAARNTGLAACSGRWVTFLDSDDLMPPQRIAQQLEAITALDRTTVILGAQSFTVAEGIEPPPEVRTALVAGGSPPYTMTMFLSLAALRSVGGFDESVAVGEDLELLMRLQRSGVPVVQHDEVWTIRRVFGDNLVYDVDGLSRARLRAVRNNRPAKASAT